MMNFEGQSSRSISPVLNIAPSTILHAFVPCKVIVESRIPLTNESESIRLKLFPESARVEAGIQSVESRI